MGNIINFSFHRIVKGLPVQVGESNVWNYNDQLDEVKFGICASASFVLRDINSSVFTPDSELLLQG